MPETMIKIRGTVLNLIKEKLRKVKRVIANVEKLETNRTRIADRI